MVISSGSCPEGCRFEYCLRNVLPEYLVVKPYNWNWSNNAPNEFGGREVKRTRRAQTPSRCAVCL